MPSFAISDLDTFSKWLKNGISEAARKGAYSTALLMVSVIQNEIIPAEQFQPVFDGHYRSGWRAEMTPEGADVINTIPYASIIEYGARGENIKIGRKMIEALTEWVSRKGLIGPRPSSGSARTDHEVRASQVAWAIALSMKDKGIFNRDGKQGLRIGERGLARAREFLTEEMSREFNRAMGTK